MQTNTEQTNTMDKLGYTPVLSKKFPSFAGVATRSEFIKAVIESLWIMIPLVILNGFMSFVKSDEAVMVLSLLSCLLTIVGVVLSFARKWIHTFVKRVHAIGKSYTKIIIYPQIAIFVLYGIGGLCTILRFSMVMHLLGPVLLVVALLCSLVYNIYALYIFIKCLSYASIDKSDNGEKSCVNRNDSLTSEEEKTHLVDTKLMILAAMKGDKSYFVDLLRHQGSDILNTQDDLGNTVLIAAARFEQVDLLELFAVMGADLEKQNKMGATALFVAAEKGFENCVNSLLQAGANVNAVTTGGRTSLMAAVQGEYVGCAKSLLIHGADANVTNSDGMSARDYAQMSENEQIRNLFSE